MPQVSTLTGAVLPTSAPTAARAVFALLRQLRVGTLEVQLPEGDSLRFGHSVPDEPHATIRLRSWGVCGAALKSGDIGFAESYMAGEWSSPDLVALLRLFIANRESMDGLIYGRWWGSLVQRVRHLLNRNSRSGSRRNIHAHYDLGNAFYRLWLDDSLSYSGAWFDGCMDGDLEAAQRAKIARALRQSGIGTGQRLLEIGCGWGALAETAARDFGACVTGITLSAEQLAHSSTRMQSAGLAGRVELRLQDYRDIPDGPYDALVSIEMFEAVGRPFWPTFFQTVSQQLKPGGRACIQTITIRDDLFERYASGTDFIQQYVFPGGLLPSVAAFRAEVSRAGLRIEDEFAFGPDYAQTLHRWRLRFLKQEGAARQLGFDSRFVHLWEFYLAYCEAAFATGNTNVVQFTLSRPAA